LSALSSSTPAKAGCFTCRLSRHCTIGIGSRVDLLVTLHGWQACGSCVWMDSLGNFSIHNASDPSHAPSHFASQSGTISICRRQAVHRESIRMGHVLRFLLVTRWPLAALKQQRNEALQQAKCVRFTGKSPADSLNNRAEHATVIVVLAVIMIITVAMIVSARWWQNSCQNHQLVLNSRLRRDWSKLASVFCYRLFGLWLNTTAVISTSITTRACPLCRPLYGIFRVVVGVCRCCSLVVSSLFSKQNT
jgi:hypothetical protein